MVCVIQPSQIFGRWEPCTTALACQMAREMVSDDRKNGCVSGVRRHGDNRVRIVPRLLNSKSRRRPELADRGIGACSAYRFYDACTVIDGLLACILAGVSVL